jgi:histidine ammonia-lyase
MPQTVTLNGLDLSLEQVEAVARGGAPVALADDARRRMQASRAVVEELVAEGATVYGVTTGFGHLAGTSVPSAEARHLQHNLLVSHAVGVGPAHDRASVRAMLLLRANTLARGRSGCRPLIVDRLLEFLLLGIHPRVPEQGSVGASGDLAPMAIWRCR